jgi:hypothetical protein
MGKKSTIIASQLPMAKWYEVIGESTVADYPNKIIMRIPVRFSIVSQFPALKY